MTMYTTPVEQILDGNGDPIVGAKKFLFSVGTTTKKTVFSDSALQVARANPVLSDADGRFPQFFLDGLYDEEQQDNSGTATGYDGATLWGPLPVGEVAEGALTLWATDNTYNIPEIVLGSDDEYYRSLTDANTGNNPVSSPGSWEQVQFGRVWNTNITYAEGDTVYGSDGFLYVSIQGTNLAKSPTINANWWRPATNQNQSAIAAGTVDAITAVMPIPLQALNDETMVTIRASGANTVTNPTFAPDGLTAKTITKNGNQALAVGDIFGAGHELQLKYNLTNDVWELLNPASIVDSSKALLADINVSMGNNIIKDEVAGESLLQTITSSGTSHAVTPETTVALDDLIWIQGVLTGGKGATAGEVYINALKNGGTAVIQAYDSSGVMKGGNAYTGISTTAIATVNGYFKVTTAGTLTLKIEALSLGSDTTLSNINLQAIVLRG